MKRGGSNRKGHAFENMIAKKLSRWWTDGERDDVFIRSDSSGGRATNRIKRGQKTFGQYGDIQAADPIGQPLIDLCVIECKDGYASDSIADLLDKEPRHKPKYEQFIQQARKSNSASESQYWMLIARRRGRRIMIFLPYKLVIEMRVDQINPLSECKPNVIIRVGPNATYFGTTLDAFLACVNAEDIKQVLS